MRPVIIGLLILAAVVALVMVAGQAPFPDSKFEFGVSRDYTGTIEDWPYPILATAEAPYLLVAAGKHGFDASGLAGKQVRLKGTLISRGPDRMLEVVTGSVQEGAAGAPPLEQMDLGPVKLMGEIVDSKCYLGVMNPGNGKVHHDCAVRCISGGAPPAFVAEDAAGNSRTLLLTGADGRALNKEVLEFVGEPIEVSGTLSRTGSTLVFKAEPRDFVRK